MSKPILLSEVFGPTIQGEGALIGRPTIFVRTAGCDYRCSWCDTLYAVDTDYSKSWQKVTTEHVMAEIEKLSQNKAMMVTLSGGNPAMQPLADLLDMGHGKGYQFAMETQGSLPRDWFSKLDVLTLSPKGPSSGEATNWEKLKQSVEAAGSETQVSMKVVIFDDADYAYAQMVSEMFPDFPLYLQAGNHATNPDTAADIPGVLDRLRWLAEKISDDRWDKVCVLPQLHVLAWGNERGV